MGGGRFTDEDWSRYSTKNIKSKATVDAIYTSRSLVSDLDPKGIKVRESCDSVDNPNSTPVIVALDVTGSMGKVLDAMAREGLKTLATEIYARKPISDPHIMMMGIGDCHAYDKAPLQMTQFEADIRIAEQLTKIYLERGGGGNNYESYLLAWYAAAMHTRIDSMEKRGKKGYLFTIGDECPTPYLTKEDIQKVFGYTPQFDRISQQELLTMVSRQYEVYHLMVEEGDYYEHYGDRAKREWVDLIGERAIPLADHKKMAEVIVSILQVANGADVKTVAASWDGSTSMVVSKAVEGLNTGLTVNNSNKGGVVKF